MDYLDKECIVFERNKEGELMPVEVEIPSLKKKILMKPMVRGEIIEYADRIRKESNACYADVIKNFLVKPALTEKEIKDLQFKVSEKVALGIMRVSMGKDPEATPEELGLPADAAHAHALKMVDKKKEEVSSSSSTNMDTTTTILTD